MGPPQPFTKSGGLRGLGPPPHNSRLVAASNWTGVGSRQPLTTSGVTRVTRVACAGRPGARRHARHPRHASRASRAPARRPFRPNARDARDVSHASPRDVRDARGGRVVVLLFFCSVPDEILCTVPIPRALAFFVSVRFGDFSPLRPFARKFAPPQLFSEQLKSRCESPCRSASVSLRCGPGAATAQRLGGRTPGAEHDHPLAARVRSSATADSTPGLPGAGGEPSQAGHAQRRFVASSCVLLVGLGISPIDATAAGPSLQVQGRPVRSQVAYRAE